MNNQMEESMNWLIRTQHVLGELGFTLTNGNVYYKDYASVDGGTYRITPIFDSGLAQDKSYRLVAIDIVSHKRVALQAGTPPPLNEFPKECLPDVTSILVQLAPEIAITPKKQVHIITASCDSCSKNSESFLHVSGKTVCLDCIED